MALYYDNHMIGQEVIVFGKVWEVITPCPLQRPPLVRLKSLSTGILQYHHPEDLKSFQYL